LERSKNTGLPFRINNAIKGKVLLKSLAALAGVSRSLAKQTIRKAEGLGLISRCIRRVKWNRNSSNILSIVCKRWLSWLGMKGGAGEEFVETTIWDCSSKKLKKCPKYKPLLCSLLITTATTKYDVCYWR
jgi:hypothetical protein